MKTNMVFVSFIDDTSESEARERSNSVRRLLTLPRSVKPKRAPECLSYTKPSLMYISSKMTTTHFWYSSREDISAASISCWSTSSENPTVALT